MTATLNQDFDKAVVQLKHSENILKVEPKIAVNRFDNRLLHEMWEQKRTKDALKVSSLSNPKDELPLT